MKQLVLTSRGLNMNVGRRLIGKIFAEDARLSEKRMLLVCLPEFAYAYELIYNACVKAGFLEENIYRAENELPKELKVDYIYVTEGNTFEIMEYMRRKGLDLFIGQNDAETTTYIGASAGAIIAGQDLSCALPFDRNFVRLTDYNGLGLLNGIVIPHCTEERLRQFLDREQELKEQYEQILHVRDDEMLVCRREGELWKVKRVRAV